MFRNEPCGRGVSYENAPEKLPQVPNLLGNRDRKGEQQ